MVAKGRSTSHADALSSDRINLGDVSGGPTMGLSEDDAAKGYG